MNNVNSQKWRKTCIQCFREVLLSELEVIAEVIIGCHCIINIKYAADSVGSIHRTEITRTSTMCKAIKTINNICKDIGCMFF